MSPPCSPGTPGNQVMRKGGLHVFPPFLPPSVSTPSAEIPTVQHWDRASGGSQPGATMRRAHGRIYHFQWKASGGYYDDFGSGFAEPFFTVRHQLLKK